jgi:ABC-type molybdate transport system substrate-binding protein
LWGDEAGEGFCSGGFRAALLALVPAFEAATGLNVAMQWGSSIAGTPTSIPARMDRGEPVDVVIGSSASLVGLLEACRILSGHTCALARSGIGLAVRACKPRWAPWRPSRARCLPAARSRSRPAPAAFISTNSLARH